MALTQEEAQQLATGKYAGNASYNGLAPVKGGWFVKLNTGERRGTGYTFLTDEGSFVNFPSNRGPQAAIEAFEGRSTSTGAEL